MEDVEDENGEPLAKRPCRRTSSAEARIHVPVCIFRGREKFQKKRKSREKLIKAIQLKADRTLRQCAILKKDTKLLAVTIRDNVAAEAHYHASCYKSYTRTKKEAEIANERKDRDENDLLYKEAENAAHEELFDYIW